jgi:hypothetical protein
VSYIFKDAETEEEFEQIRRLNHRIFAEEVAQHDRTADSRLIDKHESKSRFYIAMHQGQVVGMVCTCSQPPFSVEQRLASPDLLAVLPQPLLEIRLLAIDPEHRRRMVFLGVLGRMVARTLSQNYGTLLISAVDDRLDMYTRMGFKPIGPAVPGGAARFVPMALRLADLPENMRRDISRYVLRTS